MSVPLPSPSALPSTSARTIPRSRPTPIALDSPAEPLQSPQSPSKSALKGSGSRERRSSRTGAGGSGSALGQSPGNNDINWRERTLGSIAQGSKAKAPERTVGGFGKKDFVSPPPIGSGVGNGSGISGLSGAEAKKLSAEKVASLAHVPCRFYKAGSCTAGDSCPFSHEGGGKKEVCQWFLKGNCKFGHKCALAHLRPGEPISMDRKNKKAAQAESKGGEKTPSSPVPATPTVEEIPAAPVPIRSALSSSIQSAPLSTSPRATGSSPMREPYGPPSASAIPSGAAGFGRSPGAFGASPNRPSPLSSSFSARLSVPGALALKGAATTAVIPSRQPATAGPSAGFSSSLSHSPHTSEHARPPLSASLAGGDGSYLRRSIWAHSEKADEPLSPRRPIVPPVRSSNDVFDEDDDDHGEDLIPSSLSDLLTPIERARRMSRRDSNDYFAGSPARAGSALGAANPWIGERLAQSAGAAMGPVGFLQGLWSPGGSDIRENGKNHIESEFTFGPSTTINTGPLVRQSLLSEQLSPISPPPTTQAISSRPAVSAKGRSGDIDLTSHLIPPFFSRVADPSSPSARALSEHAPGQSLPGGVATALSRLHLQGDTTALGQTQVDSGREERERKELERREERDQRVADEREEVMFAMDG